MLFTDMEEYEERESHSDSMELKKTSINATDIETAEDKHD